MNHDFERVEAALAASLIGRALMFLDDALGRAWRRSTVGAAARSIGDGVRTTPPAALIRTIAVAVMIAAALQPLLISMMSAAVVPAMPWPAYALVASLAAVAAWQAEAVMKAWPHSAIGRRLRR